jgi:two-component system OmpR family response regulator
MTRVLLVDDDPKIVQLFSTVLEMNGFTVSKAQSASEARAAMASDSFEIVITDMHMETPTAGFEVVRAARDRSPRPIIVVVTAYPVPSAQWRGMGADALYVKGTNTTTLPHELKELLNRRVRATASWNARPIRRARFS